MAPPTVTLNAPNGRAVTFNTGLFIDGQFVEAKNNNKLATINPATEEVLAVVSAATSEDVDKAVAVARAALRGEWSKLDSTQRGNLLLKLADLVESHFETLSTLEAMDTGKAYTKATMDIKEVYEVFRYYGGFADKKYGQTVDIGKSRFGYTIREPIGVIAAITPWNYPLVQVALKIAPALACGNTVVVKPSEFTPLTNLYFAGLVQQLGFPAGVINVINGYGAETGVRISEHPDIGKISFTGSTVTGRKVMKAASGTMKKVTLETGGKSPVIVFEDADIPNALKWVQYGTFANQGQICTSTDRIYVHEKIFDDFVNRFIAYSKKHAIVGDPFDDKTWVGPLVSKAQFDRVTGYHKIAREEGLTILTGGNVYPNRPNGKGYYVEPTVAINAAPDSRLIKEEIFGPFGVFTKFSDEDAVIKVANDTEYGLGAALFTKDVVRAIRVSQQLEAGMVWINSSNNSDYRIPFGGYKQSGIGKDGGYTVMDEYSNLKTIYLSLQMTNDE